MRHCLRHRGFFGASRIATALPSSASWPSGSAMRWYTVKHSGVIAPNQVTNNKEMDEGMEPEAQHSAGATPISRYRHRQQNYTRQVLKKRLRMMRQEAKEFATLEKEAMAKQEAKREERLRRRAIRRKARQAYHLASLADHLNRKAEERKKVIEFIERKEEVERKARVEFLAALNEDAHLWKEHPAELMNRKYRTYNDQLWYNVFN